MKTSSSSSASSNYIALLGLLAVLAVLAGSGAGIFLHQFLHSPRFSAKSPAPLIVTTVESGKKAREGGPPPQAAKGQAAKAQATRTTERLTPAQVPQSVLEAFQPFLTGFSVVEAQRKRDSQQQETEYEMTLAAGDRRYEATLVLNEARGRTEGELRGRVAAADLPQPVIAAFQKYLSGRTLTDAEKQIAFVKGGSSSTEYRWRFNEPRCRLSVNAEGRLMDLRETVSTAALPEPVKQTIEKHLPRAQLDSTGERRGDSEGIYFRLNARTESGQRADITVGADGGTIRIRGNETATTATTPAPAR